ncbi:hypothetical protein VNI00_016036 [Paramarasmius palmivorus]|uniref:Uncharacterized protein n=1 Tax=Paramarasmius palmivorus TaxID=297713 RepID=A0AAW0BHV2_9AGAR
MFTCTACNARLPSYTGYKLHLQYSPNLTCRQLYDQLQSYIPEALDSDSSDLDDEDGMSTDEGEIPEFSSDSDDEDGIPKFEGDYFGDDYDTDDFGMVEDNVGRIEEGVVELGLGDGEDEELATTENEPSPVAPISVPYHVDELDSEAEIDAFTSRQAFEERLREQIVVEKFP